MSSNIWSVASGSFYSEELGTENTSFSSLKEDAVKHNSSKGHSSWASALEWEIRCTIKSDTGCCLPEYKELKQHVVASKLSKGCQIPHKALETL